MKRLIASAIALSVIAAPAVAATAASTTKVAKPVKKHHLASVKTAKPKK